MQSLGQFHFTGTNSTDTSLENRNKKLSPSLPEVITVLCNAQTDSEPPYGATNAFLTLSASPVSATILLRVEFPLPCNACPTTGTVGQKSLCR